MALSNTAVPKYYGMFRDAVIRGEIPVNKEISMEMNRIDDLIANPGVYYDDKAVEGFILYCENELTLTDGSDLNLLDSFKVWSEQIFGWYYFVERSVYEPSEDGHGGHYVKKHIRKRLINKQYLIVARGAAKSMYGSCLQKQYAEQAVDAAAKAASSASQASGYASTANSRASAAASSASGAASSASAANTSAANAKSYADSAASSKNAAASSASNASASATNAKKSETAAANSASLAQAAYEEILGADVGKFGSQLANEHSVLQPIYDSSGQNICDSSGREIQGRIIFADESEVVSLRQQVSHLDTFIRSVISRLGYVTDHALLDSDYKGL